MAAGERNGNGNGAVKFFAPWIIAGLAVGLALFASAKDTPTRPEMQRADSEVESRITQRLTRIEDKVDRLLEAERRR